MRSLSLISTRSWSVPSTDGKVTAQATDVENDCVYVLTEDHNTDLGVEVKIYKANHGDIDDTLSFVTSFTIESLASGDQSRAISFRYFPDSQSLALITASGDIGLIAVDDASPGSQFEVVGTIDHGVKYASWSPDDTLLVLITGDDKLLLMTSSFDVISETQLHSSQKGEGEQVNVGWGSKQTQFHGSLGKAAARAPSISPESIGSSPDDDGVPRVSWRGDGVYFVVSSLEQSDSRSHRILQVYDRNAILQNTSEDVGGLEHTLSWRPSGNLIASSQRFGFEGGGAGKEGRHDVVFFERNGLRHGEFSLREQPHKSSGKKRWGYKVRELLWNSDSSVLSVWLESDNEGDIVQLWTPNNYYWYLKQEMLAPKVTKEDDGRLTSLAWHPEQSLTFIMSTKGHIFEIKFIWETHRANLAAPNDTGSIAVVDGKSLLLTPFRIQNVPPPMSSLRLQLADNSRTPLHVSLSNSHDSLAILYHTGNVEVWDLKTRLIQGRGNPYDPIRKWFGELRCEVSGAANAEPIQVLLTKVRSETDNEQISTLWSDESSDILVNLLINQDGRRPISSRLPGKNGRLVNSNNSIFYQSSDGCICQVQFSDDKIALKDAASFNEFCIHTESRQYEDESIFVGRSDSGKLYIASSTSSNSLCMTPNSTSFILSSDFLIYTTSSHEAFFAPIEKLSTLSKGEEVKAEQLLWERRRVERGSRIVTVLPSSMSLVLQMPRGNLETINPRPLVLKVVKREIDSGNYLKAFIACRKHRIDLSVIVDHDRVSFMNNIPSFVSQVNDVDHLNLFLTNLGQSSQDKAAVAEICDAVREVLEKRDLTKYVNSILTAHVVKTPPDLEASLSLLLRIREADLDLVEEAVKYVIFLVDANKLYDTALGMYDFSLVLMIAQHSQKDPREYLPFLRELRSLVKFYQRFRIDDHLRRHQSALKNLHRSGPDHFDEFLNYAEKHRLFTLAISLCKENLDDYKRVLNIYGDWLYDRHDYKQAAWAFVDAVQLRKALVAYERALQWRELFDLAMREGFTEDHLKDMAYRVAEELSSKKRYGEAARVLLDYASDLRACAESLVQGNDFSEAHRLITIHKLPDLILEILHPAALESRAQISEDLDEIGSQLRNQVFRLRELRVKKVEEPDAFYGVEDPSLHNVDVMTDVSMPATAFTRYTVALSTSSRTSKRTSRSKRKMERKVGSGRKGTIDEEEYILHSIVKLVSRFESTQGDAEQLIPHLMRFSEEHRQEARSLQDDIAAVREELQSAVDEIWKKPADDEDEGSGASLNASSWAARMEEKRRDRENAILRITKPPLSSQRRVEILDI